MIVLLDTSVLIDLLRARAVRRVLVADLVHSGHTLVISTINLAEVYSGMRVHEQAATDAFLARFPCLPVTATIARRAGLLRGAFARVGQTLTLSDMLIAATTLEHGCTLATDNRRDFPIPELQLLPLS